MRQAPACGAQGVLRFLSVQPTSPQYRIYQEEAWQALAARRVIYPRMQRKRVDGSRSKTAYGRDVLASGAVATLVSGIPSTIYAWVTGGDITEATRAAGAMLIPPSSDLPALVLAAGVAHTAISFFWAAILVFILPRNHVIVWATAAAVLIALLDLRIIAPAFFPEVAALRFGPQLADHLMWGASLGWTLARRWRHTR
jgi:hypothetical protein